MNSTTNPLSQKHPDYSYYKNGSEHLSIRSLGFPLFGLILLLAAGCSATSAVKPQTQIGTKEASTAIAPEVDEDATTVYQVLLGEIAHQRGDNVLSAEALYQAAERTRDPDLIKRSTTMAIASGRYDIALESARVWVETLPDDSVARDTYGLLLLEKGDIEAAKPELLKSLQLRADDLPAAFQRVAEIIASRKGLDAPTKVKTMQYLVDQYPGNPDGQYALAYLATLAEAPETAMQAANAALKAHPDWEDAGLIKLQLLAQDKKYAEMNQFAERFLKRYPLSRKFRIAYARHLVAASDHERATAQFKQLYKEEPNSAELALAVGLLALESEHYDEASTYLKRALKLDPENDQIRIYLGQIEEAQEHHTQALKWYDAVKSPEYMTEAIQRRAGVMAKQGNTDAALAYLDKAPLSNNDDKVNLYLSKEAILREAGREQDALKNMDQALSEFPDNTELLYSRGLLRANMKLIEGAEEDLRKVIEQEPENAEALNALGYTLADSTERYQEAYDLIAKALTLKPGDAYILDSMGWVQFKLGNSQEAIKLMKQAMSKMDDPEIAAHLGEILYVSGDHQQAEAVWSEALKKNPEHKLLLETIQKFRQ